MVPACGAAISWWRPGGASLWPRDLARAFLTEFLRDGPRATRDIWQAALSRDLTEHTLRRAKTELEIRSARTWADGKRLSYWLLPDQKLEGSPANDDGACDLEEWLAPLREKYPPATPLDDL